MKYSRATNSPRPVNIIPIKWTLANTT
jgi:hypothetical protein